MENNRFKNLFLVLTVILIIIGIPYLLYALGSLIEINHFGYINNWWLVLVFIVVLISFFILRQLNFEKYMAHFFLLLFTIPFFLLGIKLGAQYTIDSESYKMLVQKDVEIDQLEEERAQLTNDLLHLENQATLNADFKRFELVFFDLNRADLSDYNKKRIKAFISNHENCKLTVSGYSDDSGNESTNKEISMQRAKNVADYIKSINIENHTIHKVQSYGDMSELAANKNELSRALNRRVSIEIVGKTDVVIVSTRIRIHKDLTKISHQLKVLKEQRDSLRKLVFSPED
jgi:outer membrane protein OmpA-like peptidoglycan-associated protein